MGEVYKFEVQRWENVKGTYFNLKAVETANGASLKSPEDQATHLGELVLVIASAAIASRKAVIDAPITAGSGSSL